MTEAEWNTSTDTCWMLHSGARRDGLPLPMTERKLRLFLVGCCRRQWRLPFETGSQLAVDTAERYADGQASEARRVHFEREVGAAARLVSERFATADIPPGRYIVGLAYELSRAAHLAVCSYDELIVPISTPKDSLILAIHGPFSVAQAFAYSVWLAQGEDAANWSELLEVELTAQAELLRCIAGNPFRPVAADPAWLTSAAVGLASAIYAERAFDRLPILADALEDAGCDHLDVLAHCRTHPEHARGCWVVDLILGKA